MAKAGSRRTPLWEKGPHDRRLLRFLGQHCLLGLVTGLVFSGAFLALNIAGLRDILTATREGGLAIFMFCFAISFLFGSVAMGVGVMTLPRDMSYGEHADPEARDRAHRP